MAVYCISYDLNKQGQNYNALYEELKNTDYQHILGSTWLISTNETATQISARLRQRMDNNDSLFISRVNRGESDGWMSTAYWNWLHARV
ncbi:hypothetical protein GCM10027594_11000 [Hymenobacter agri]